MNRIQHIPGIIVTFFYFIIYGLTLAPGISSQDAGELANAQYSLDIAHPTGYPLFTMAGYLWSKVPLGLSPIFQLNLLAALYTAISLFVLYKAVSLFMNYSSPQGEDEGSITKFITPAVISISTLAFGQTVWYQSTGTEVYSLHLLLMSLIIWQTFKAFSSSSSGGQWRLLGLFVGLGMCNHLTTILILPGIIYLYFRKEGLTQRAIKSAFIPVAISIAIIVLGYSYLFIRSNQAPLINWGNTSNLQNLYFHISGKLYQEHVFNSWSVSWENLLFFVKNLTREYSILALILVVAGFAGLWKNQPTLFIFYVGTIGLSVVIVINYNIPDLQSYFLLIYIMMAMLLTTGIKWFCDLPYTRDYKAIPYLMVLIPLLAIFSNFKTVDQSQNMVLHTYAKNQLKSVPRNAIILSAEYDIFTSSSYYFQHVEKVREDVTVIDFLALLGTEWYANYLIKYDPQLASTISQSLTSYQQIIAARGEENWTLQQQQTSFKTLIHNLIASNITQRPIFISHLVYKKYLAPDGHIPIPNTYQITPQRYLYQVTSTQEYLPFNKEDVVEISFTNDENPYTSIMQKGQEFPITLLRDLNFLRYTIKYRMPLMMDHRIQYELRWGQFEKAQQLHNSLESKFPKYQIPVQIDHLFHDD